MPPGGLKAIFAQNTQMLSNDAETALLHDENVKNKVGALKVETTERASMNNDETDGSHEENKKRGFGEKRFPGYENGHGTEQGNMIEAKMSAEQILRQDRQKLLDFDPSALEIARENYLDVAKIYAGVEQKHRTMMEGLNKYFNSTNIGSKIVGTRIGKRFKYQDNEDVKGERLRYEHSLQTYRNTWIEDMQRRMKLEDGKLEGTALEEEVRKMLAEFNCNSVLELGAQRNFAKAESLWGGSIKTKNKKPLRKADSDFDGLQQSVTGRETYIAPGSPLEDGKGNTIVGKSNDQVIYGKPAKSVYGDVYEKGEHPKNRKFIQDIKTRERIYFDSENTAAEDDSDYADFSAWENMDVRVKNLLARGWDSSWAGLEAIGGAYKKLPTSIKIGLGVATWASGAGALIVGRRVIGGIAAGTGAAGALNANQERSFKKKTAAGNEINLDEIIQGREKTNVEDVKKETTSEVEKDKEVEKKKEAEKTQPEKKEIVVDFEKLKKITDRQILQIDDKMNDLKVKTWFNRVAGITLGIALGSGWAQGETKALLGKAWGGAKHLYGLAGFGTATAGAAEIPAGAMGATTGIASTDHWSENAHGQGVAMENESVQENMTAQRFEVSEPWKDAHGHLRHDSFIRSIREHIKGHPGIDNADAEHIAELSFHDAAKEYALAHHITYDQAFEKLSRIHPGTSYEITWNSDGHPVINIDDEHIKFMKGPAHHLHHAVSGHHAGIHDHHLPKHEITDGSIKTPPPGFNEVPPDFVENHQGQFPPPNAGTPPDYVPEHVVPIDQAHNFAYNPVTYLEQVQAIPVQWVGGPSIEVLVHNGASPGHIFRPCLRNMVGSHSEWLAIKDKPFMEVAFSPDGKVHKGIAAVAQQFSGIKGMDNNVLPINRGETTGRWLARVTNLATRRR